MKTVGIIAEFNPFHNGHKYIIEKAKELTGADTAVIIMSGDFVQRGAPAICSKYLRTEMAILSGADIVFELPALFSLSCAEQFAYGAVKLLSSTLNIDHICFGSENGNISELNDFALKTEEFSETDEFKTLIASAVKEGMSYPAAFEKVIADRFGFSDSSLYSPNNILGIEYLRAIHKLQTRNIYSKLPSLCTVKREGSGYHDTGLSSYPSATSVRNAINSGDISGLSEALPPKVFELINSKCGLTLPVLENDFSDMLYIKLNSSTDEELYSIPDVNRDIINMLIKMRGRHIVISDLITSLKNKSFTYTAISRALFKLLLSPLYKEAYEYTFSGEKFRPYLRTLGFKSSASEFLRNLRKSETCSLITKPADGDMKNPVYLLDIYASDMYEQICANNYKTGFTDELKTGPVIIS